MLREQLPAAIAVAFITLAASARSTAEQQIHFELTESVPITTPHSIAAGDFDEDGAIDIAVASFFSNTVVIERGLGEGAFELAQAIAVPSPSFVVTADIDRDGHLDLIVVDFYNDRIVTLRGTGTGSFAAPVDIQLNGFVLGVRVDDLNGDEYPDLIAPVYNNDLIAVFLNDGSGAFPTMSTSLSIAEPSFVTSADLNLDGFADLLVTSTTGSNFSLCYGDGTGSFPSTIFYDLGVDDTLWFIEAQDLNRDERPDLVIPCPNLDMVAIYLASPYAGFYSPTVFSSGMGPSELIVRDFDFDHIGDLLTLNETGEDISVAKGNGQGDFQLEGSFPATGSCLSMKAVDLNGDHYRDIVVADYAAGELRILMNRTGEYGDVMFVRGDADGDGSLTVADPVTILTHLYTGADPLDCPDAADVTDDGAIQLDDAIVVVTALFSPGVSLAFACEFDSVPDTLPACHPMNSPCPTEGRALGR